MSVKRWRPISRKQKFYAEDENRIPTEVRKVVEDGFVKIELWEERFKPGVWHMEATRFEEVVK